MADLEIAYLLPLPGWPEAVFASDYLYTGGTLTVAGTTVVKARHRVELERGVEGRLAPEGQTVVLHLTEGQGGAPELAVLVDGTPAVRPDRLRATTSRSAWLHAIQALAASAAGFVASYLYLLRAAGEQGDWALKMANHMAGWHLLLTFTLFPASVWGQRAGIRGVQIVSALFFAIHVGIALANLGSSDSGEYGGAISFFNALSGALFLVAAVYGNRAYRDMDPVAALRAGRIPPLRKPVA